MGEIFYQVGNKFDQNDNFFYLTYIIIFGIVIQKWISEKN